MPSVCEGLVPCTLVTIKRVTSLLVLGHGSKGESRHPYASIPDGRCIAYCVVLTHMGRRLLGVALCHRPLGLAGAVSSAAGCLHVPTFPPVAMDVAGSYGPRRGRQCCTR